MNKTQKRVVSPTTLIVVVGSFVFVLIVLLVWRIERPKMEQGDSPPSTHRSNLQAQDEATDDSASAETTRFVLERVRRDPDDFLAENMLAGAMLQKVRETGNADYLEAAMRASKASLASVPAERNTGGLSARARVEMAEHDFVGARADGIRLTQLNPGTLNSWGVLTDALLELGEYAKADAAIQEMRKLGGDTAETEIRVGRLLFLQGDTPGAQKHLFRALAFALNVPAPPRETVAWCRWQSGEMAFSIADYDTAEHYYRSALATYPDYVQALASLGRLLAGRGDLNGAIAQYEKAVRRFPDPTFVGALGDLYHLAGREKEAQTEYALVEQIGHLSALNGSRYNRQIALFDADHGKNSDEAYNDAVREYRDRRDIYGADAVAWTAVKAGRVREAQQAISAALRLSTRDARLYYHAGMVARAAGNKSAASEYLRRAMKLNPYFDPLQAPEAKKALHS